MFAGFTLERIDVGDAELRVRYGGSGPAVLLLHGHRVRPGQGESAW
jgi:haloacetate dehalogenase